MSLPWPSRVTTPPQRRPERSAAALVAADAAVVCARGVLLPLLGRRAGSGPLLRVLRRSRRPRAGLHADDADRGHRPGGRAGAGFSHNSRLGSIRGDHRAAARRHHRSPRGRTRRPRGRHCCGDCSPGAARAAAPCALGRVVDAQDGPRPADVSPITHAVVPRRRRRGGVSRVRARVAARVLPERRAVVPRRRHRAARRVLVMLLAGFEVNRRKAEREADRAARALGEKQNLLNTMQVPLIVVDPNTDEIVSANRSRSRSASGAGRGSPSGSRPSRGRARTTSARRSPPAKRAAPTACRSASTHAGGVEHRAVRHRPLGRRHRADRGARRRRAASARHPVSRRSAVGPAAAARGRRVGRPHRRAPPARRPAVPRPRLAGRCASAARSSDTGQTRVRHGSDPGLTPWLAEYLQRRIHVTAWLLDHWDAPPPEHDSVVDAAQAHETLRSLERIFAEVSDDTDLRSRLGWANGPLADRSSASPFTTADRLAAGVRDHASRARRPRASS